MISEETLWSRWSRRKRQSEQQNQDEESLIEQQLSDQAPIPLQSDVEEQTAIQRQQEATDESVLTDEDMPNVDSLGEDSDYSGFMSPGVSDELRNLALRKLFSAPSFNICDGLDEYDEDYTSFEKLGSIITSDMKHQMEMEAQKEQLAQPDSETFSQQQQALINDEPNHGDDIELPGEETAALDEKRVERTNHDDQKPSPAQTTTGQTHDKFES